MTSTQDNRPVAGERLLTTREVAARFRVTPQTVHRWHRAGKLTSVSPGTYLRFREDQVLALLNGRAS